MFSARMPFFAQPIAPATDPYWTSVTFLENFETPQTAFVDGSTNNQAVTISAGAPIPNYSSPFTGTGGSIYVNGSTSISVPTSSALYQFTGDFTIECWAYMNSYSAIRYLISNWPGLVATNDSWAMGVNATGRLLLAYGIGSSNIAITATTTTVSLNTWTHLAITRSGTTVRLFVNGVQDGTVATVSGTLNNNPSPLYLGVLNPTEAQYWLGNISNARVVKGVGVYTTGFTPSTLPLPATQSANVYGNPSAAITGTQTSLLMNFTNLGMQNNTTYADISTITATPSTAGGTNVPIYAGLTPFTNTYPGSYYFNISYFTMPTNAAYAFGTGDFTVEFWFRANNISTTQTMFDMRNPDTQYAGFDIYLFGNKVNSGTSGVNYIVGTTTLSSNTWYHVALSRISNVMTLYLNGVSQGSYSISRNFTNQIPKIGGGLNGNFTGYLSNVRMVKGVGVYTANFTPSTLPLPATQSANVYGSPSAAITGTQTSLLIPGTTGGFQDLSTSGQRITNTTSTTSVKTVSATQQFKFGTQSNTLLPTAYQTVIDATSLQFGTGDFTIEGWVYTNAAGVLYGIINKGASTPTGWSIEINTSNQLIWYSTSTAVKTSTDTIPASTWTYFAISRSGTNLYMFINGNLQGSAGTDSANYNQTTNMIIGATRAAGNGLNGYLDDLRITKGVCRYTASFSAPTAAFPTS